MNIVFTVKCRFPYGEAMSARARNLCQLFHFAGHNVHVISDYSSEAIQNNLLEYCTYENLFDKNLRFKNIIKSCVKCLEKLKNYCEINKIDVIFTDSSYEKFCKLAEFSRKNGYKLIVENCEWYDYSNFKLKMFDIRFILNEKLIRHDFRKADAFVSISRLLDEHNRSFGKPSVRIPTIIDLEETVFNEKNNNEKIIISYAGNPGKSKENLNVIISAISDIEDYKNKIEFHIYGADIKKVSRNVGNKAHLLEKLSDSVFIHGKIPQKDMETVFAKSDYSIFIRPKRRSSEAGFPTKLAESMAVGTPVIANDTGDVGLYLHDGENGFLLKNDSAEELKSAFQKILVMDSEKMKIMRKNARNTAENSFDYKNYASDIKKILDW